MSKTVTCIGLILLSFYSVYGQKNAVSNEASIIGGREAKEQEFPWMAAVRLNFEVEGERFEDLCGGSLIREQWILTAAHCVSENLGIKAERVILNSLLSNSQPLEGHSEVLNVDTVFVHPGFNDSSATIHDIALLRLSRPSQITPISLAKEEESELFDAGKMATVIGWGFNEDTVRPEQLMVAEVNLFHSDTCAELYSKAEPGFDTYGLNPEGSLCAGYREGEAPSGASAGDSGGPLFVADAGVYKQIGVVVGGHSYRTTADFPGVFTLVPKYADWIDSVISLYELSTSVSSVSADEKQSMAQNFERNELVFAGLEVNENYKLAVFDMTGRRKLYWQLDGSVNRVSLRGLSSGLHAAVLYDSSNRFVTREKIIIR